jgi:hypothetical protein
VEARRIPLIERRSTFSLPKTLAPNSKPNHRRSTALIRGSLAEFCPTAVGMVIREVSIFVALQSISVKLDEPTLLV